MFNCEFPSDELDMESEDDFNVNSIADGVDSVSPPPIPPSGLVSLKRPREPSTTPPPPLSANQMAKRPRQENPPSLDEIPCNICLETVPTAGKRFGLPCMHVYCVDCLDAHFAYERRASVFTCPACRRKIHPALVDEAYQECPADLRDLHTWNARLDYINRLPVGLWTKARNGTLSIVLTSTWSKVIDKEMLKAKQPKVVCASIKEHEKRMLIHITYVIKGKDACDAVIVAQTPIEGGRRFIAYADASSKTCNVVTQAGDKISGEVATLNSANVGSHHKPVFVYSWACSVTL